MPKIIDLTGRRFDNLVVIERGENSKSGDARWICLCDCGNQTLVWSYSLRKGRTKSCGCERLKKFTDLKGRRFGRLIVEHRAENTSGDSTTWHCKCDCGADVVIQRSHLISEHTQSCGCLHKEIVRENATKHQHSGTRLYDIWSGMKRRTSNPNRKDFKYYGGRGITVCREWENDFEAFYEWSMKNGYVYDLTIDRKDNDKGYSPNNCRWTDMLTQNHNKRKPKNR